MSSQAAVASHRLAEVGSMESDQYLTFTSKDEMFALSILNVKEILEFSSVTEIPMMPDFIKGVINLRGAVVPVIDLCSRFGGGVTGIQRRTCIVIVEVINQGARQDLGVLVDSVSEVLDLPSREIETAPTFGASIRADFIHGIGKVDGRFVIILDMEKVLSMDEMSRLTEISSFDGTDFDKLKQQAG